MRSGPTRSLNVTGQLRDLLLRGEFAPGSHLQEITLAEQMQVSRTPIREALRLLQQDGLVTYQPNRGYVVKRFAREDVLQAFDVRAVLEGLAARTVAGREDRMDCVTCLEACLQQGDRLLAMDPWMEAHYQAWRDMNTAFHAALLDHARNPLLGRFCADSSKIPGVFNGSFRWYSPTEFRRSHDHHHVISEAVRAGDRERADWFMREHIHHAAGIIRRHIPDT